MTTSIIVIVLIIYLSIKNNLKGKLKKITPKSIILLPILLLYYIYTTIINMNYAISFFSLLVFAVAIIIGSLIGLYRSKLYSFKCLDGDVFYSKHVFDSFALIVLLVFDTLLRFVFQKYDSSLFSIINLALILFATSSIIARRIIIFIKYTSLKGTL